VPIVQISRIQHRRGRSTDLPQLAAGELGWVIDEQKLFIGNGTVADGAPAVGNTEILTSGSSAFSSALKYVYKGYLGNATPIITGAGVDVLRTLQERLDDYVSVKAFGAVGDGVANDTVAIQRALEEIYSDVVDQDEYQSSRILFFPAGTYNITASLKIPPYARLLGEGIDGSVIYQMGGAVPVAVTEDNGGNTYGTIGAASAVAPTQISIEGIHFWNGESYAGFSIDCATNVRFVNCGFKGTYAAGGANNDNSAGVRVRSTSALPCSNIIFDSCQFKKFSSLVDFSEDVTSVKFINCDFNEALNGARLGYATDGSTNGKTYGPVNIQFLHSTWSNIGRNAIKAHANGSVRNVISFGNWYSANVGNDFEEYSTNDPNDIHAALSFSANECSSHMDYFERSDLRSSTIAPAQEVEGVSIVDGTNKEITLANNTAAATTTGIRIKAIGGSAMVIKYKIDRGTNFRTGTLTAVGAEGTTPSFNDEFEETADIGVVLTVAVDDLDSTVTPGNETFVVKYTTTSTGTNATMNYRTTILS